MLPQPVFGSPSFNLVAKGLLDLHRLIKEGKDDSMEAEAIRDALDAPLKALNPTEKARAQWLSEDLYSVSEPPAAINPKEMNPQAQQQLNEAFEARQSGEWDRALALLRRWREYIAPALLGYLRGSIWLEAGNPEVAAVFYRHASQSDPANAHYRAVYLHALAESDPSATGKLAKDVLLDAENQAPVVVARAAAVRFNETRTASDADSAQLYRDLIPVLDRNVAKLEADENEAGRRSAYAMTVGLLGFCHELLGNAGVAVDYYSRGLQADPNNDGLLVGRGILQYGCSRRAVTDFEQAVRLGTPVVWPYLFLAHHYLSTERFDECRAMCETGLKMQASDTVKSQLEEWRAIAQAELGFSPDLVGAAFEAAIRFDPTNDLAKRNQAAFEACLRATRAPHGLEWQQKSELALRQLGLAERRYSLAA
ncbi:MAG TPA: hypothetical protein VNH11_35445 [Pirellulales bacterium]|nr:hypothetical protein [Pirellulales bacterium]